MGHILSALSPQQQQPQQPDQSQFGQLSQISAPQGSLLSSLGQSGLYGNQVGRNIAQNSLNGVR